jgi:hypothetical protein
MSAIGAAFDNRDKKPIFALMAGPPAAVLAKLKWVQPFKPGRFTSRTHLICSPNLIRPASPGNRDACLIV